MHPLFHARTWKPVQWLSRRLDVPLRARLDGVSFPVFLRVGPNLSLLLASGRVEAPERRAFVRQIQRREAQTFWDVGANIGLYSFTFLEQRPNGHVVALEPDPRNAACLLRTKIRNRLDGLTIVQAAASDTAGEAEFQIDWLTGATGALSDVGDSFLNRHYGLVPETMKVASLRLDDLLTSHPPPDIMKIDVEGAEMRVLRGAEAVLARRPTVLIECSTPEPAALLKARGYDLFDASTGEPAEMAFNLLAVPRDAA